MLGGVLSPSCAGRGITIIKWLVERGVLVGMSVCDCVERGVTNLSFNLHSLSLPPSLPPPSQPNSVGIHPAEKRCDNFYKKMKELNLVS